MNGILSRQYHKASFLQFSLTSKRRRVLSENDFVSVIHVSLSSEKLLSGVVLGGDCASAVSDEVEETDGFRREATFVGLKLFSPGWQTKASPSPEKKRIDKGQHKRFRDAIRWNRNKSLTIPYVMLCFI